MERPRVEADDAPRNQDQRRPAKTEAVPKAYTLKRELVSLLLRRIGSGFISFRIASVLQEFAVIGCFLAILWAGIAVGLNYEYHNAQAAAGQSTSNLARAFEESTRRTIGQIDQTLLSARAFYKAQGSRFDFSEWAHTQTLTDKMTSAIGMADTSGHVFADTLPFKPGISIFDRPHFQAQISPAHDSLFISQPVHGRVSRQDTIQFTRKLLGPDGKFAGVTVFSLDCAELSRFYETLELGQGSVSLLSAEGTILAHGPLVPQLIGTSIGKAAAIGKVLTQPVGTISFLGSRTHIAKIASFRHLQDYPLIVMVSFDAEKVFQQYRSLRNHVILSGVIVTCFLGIIGALWVRQKQQSLASHRALTITLNTISQGIVMIDERGRVPVVNPRALNLLKLPGETLQETLQSVGSRAIALVADRTSSAHIIPFNQGAASDHDNGDSQFETARDDGTVLEVRKHRLPNGGFVHTYTDITAQRLADAQVRYLAHFDTLTGLANRVQLRRRMSDILGQRPGADQVTAFIMIDLDGFKGVNDTLGHAAGDELLVEVARRLRTLVRETDIVARLGGDEFVIVSTGLHRPQDAILLAERVLQRLADPEQVCGQSVRIGASIGIAFHPQDGEDGDVLFKNADIALYSAKSGGRGTYRCFDAALTLMVNEHHLLESDLRKAIAEQEIEVHFQPKFAAKSLEIVGFEALARWQHPTRGFISPATFIRIAEECGLINLLGLWIIKCACAAVADWTSQHPVAVNVSVVQLRAGTLQHDIAAILRQTGLAAELLEIEVTESVMVDDNATVLGTLQALKAMGIRIALDDFGTGYSSLSYLRRFSFDKIKIDKSFVQGQASDQGVRVILEAILGMCHNLGLDTVGEGVETAQQLKLLQDCGCTEVQGYLLGRPMPNDAVQQFVGNLPQDTDDLRSERKELMVDRAPRRASHQHALSEASDEVFAVD